MIESKNSSSSDFIEAGRSFYLNKILNLKKFYTLFQKKYKI